MDNVGERTIPLISQKTYVFIDVSNIRLACLKTLGFRIDFVKLLEYLRRKYLSLEDVRYYEGIARGDTKKRRMFGFLKRKGYTICSLERKSYISTSIEERGVECPKCGNKWTVRMNREYKTMKSNVDVYLATDLLTTAIDAIEPTHILLVSCDGDYVETIETVIRRNGNVSISVLATPTTSDLEKNTMSVRLRKLFNVLPKNRYRLLNIDDLRQNIESSLT